MMHRSWMWASQTSCTISWFPMPMCTAFVPSMLARSPVAVLILTAVGVHAAESTPLVPRRTEGNAGPGLHQSSARLAIQLTVHEEPLGVAQSAYQGASALEGRWVWEQGSPHWSPPRFLMAARSEAWVRLLDSPGRGDQPHCSDDSGCDPTVIFLVTWEFGVTPDRPRCHPPLPVCGLSPGHVGG